VCVRTTKCVCVIERERDREGETGRFDWKLLVEKKKYRIYIGI